MADVPTTNVQDAPVTESQTLTLTPVALGKVRELMAERNLVGYGLRVFVQGGGCSGLQYGMAFDNNVYNLDTVVEIEGTRLIIDASSLLYMHGAEIDFVDSLMGGGFAINNPNAVSSCGCGHSFRAEEGGEAEASGGGCGCGSCH